MYIYIKITIAVLGLNLVSIFGLRRAKLSNYTTRIAEAKQIKMSLAKWIKNCEWIDSTYNGPTEVEAFLIKNKWNSSISIFFSKFIKRYFVLNLKEYTFGYYHDSEKKKGSFQIPLSKIKKVTLEPLTHECPAETSTGFSVITEERPYHLFVYGKKVKVEFLYAFSSVLTIGTRPSLEEMRCLYYIENEMPYTCESQISNEEEKKKEEEKIVLIPNNEKNITSIKVPQLPESTSNEQKEGAVIYKKKDTPVPQQKEDTPIPEQKADISPNILQKPQEPKPNRRPVQIDPIKVEIKTSEPVEEENRVLSFVPKSGSKKPEITRTKHHENTQFPIATLNYDRLLIGAVSHHIDIEESRTAPFPVKNDGPKHTESGETEKAFNEMLSKEGKESVIPIQGGNLHPQYKNPLQKPTKTVREERKQLFPKPDFEENWDFDASKNAKLEKPFSTISSYRSKRFSKKEDSSKKKDDFEECW